MGDPWVKEERRPTKSKYRGGAVLSGCGRYRYELRREFTPKLGIPRRAVGFVMLNPSTADHETDDNTVTKVCGYAQRWDFTDVVVANLFAWRSAEPSDLLRYHLDGFDVIGAQNELYLEALVQECELVVCGWGVHGGDVRLPIRITPPHVAALPETVKTRGEYVRRVLDNARILHARPRLTYLKLTKDGIPGHPLYLKNDAQPQEWK